MRPLRLDLAQLSVDSFPTLAAPAARGTVAAHGDATPLCNVTELDCQTNLVYCPSRVVTQCGCLTGTTGTG